MNTLFMRLESPLQSWGYDARFVTRTTALEPTKSGVVGLICACAGYGRKEAKQHLSVLNDLRMGVRIDRAGKVMTDYQTVSLLDDNGRKTARTADEKTPQKDTEETFREYLSDASFLVALQGNKDTLESVKAVIHNPVFTPYLGRKCCVPSTPLYEGEGDYIDLETALNERVWKPRVNTPPQCTGFVEISKYTPDAIIRKDVLVSLIPHVLVNRLVKRVVLTPRIQESADCDTLRWRPENSAGKANKDKRWAIDKGLCVVCRLPGAEVHHIRYERVVDGILKNIVNEEDPEIDLRTVCKPCHDSITALEYENDMPNDNRLDPLDRATQAIILKRRQLYMGK